MASGTLRFDIDTSAWEREVAGLTSSDITRGLRAGFRRSATILRRGIQEEVKAGTAPHRKGVKRWTPRGYFYPKPLHRDVKIAVFRVAIGANVSLCNPRNPDNRAYVLRMLNKGSGQRATRKGLNRGSLKGLGFFKSGINRSKDEAIAELNKNIRDEIMKKVNS